MATSSAADPVPDIDVVVVSWNTSRAAIRAAESFLASDGVNCRVTVADNGSEEEERALLRDGVPSPVSLKLSERNLGYGRAANAALAEGEAPLVVISNADVSFDPSQLAKLAAVALNEERAGMVGPVFSGATNAYHSRLPRPADLVARAFIGRLGRKRVGRPSRGEVAEVEQVSGAIFLMRRATWAAVGGFDETFFLWYDDVDLARRLVDLGYRNLVVGDAFVTHGGATSFRQVPRADAQAIRLRSLQAYIEKHHHRMHVPARPLLALARFLRVR